MTVYLRPTIHNHAKKVLEGTLSKIGRKYYTVVSHHQEYKFRVEDNSDASQYGPNYALYFSKEDLDDGIERDKLLVRMSRFFQLSSNESKTLTLGQLRRIAAIIDTEPQTVSRGESKVSKLKRVVTIEGSFARDTQIFTADPATIEVEPDWEDNFSDAKYPCLYVGIYEGDCEKEIRDKAAADLGVHPDVMTLTSIEPVITAAPVTPGIIIGRPINGISINGLEYVSDDDGKPMEFPSVEAAKAFLTEHGVTQEAIEEMRFRNAETMADVPSDAEIFVFERLMAHVGHKTVVVNYAGDRNVSIECMKCNEVLYSVDNPKYLY